ncbi:MAG TPA: arylesterase [Acidobacteriaceae bacterium]|nr:arylesterase [Acidobacteriaceae bacterium]
MLKSNWTRVCFAFVLIAPVSGCHRTPSPPPPQSQSATDAIAAPVATAPAVVDTRPTIVAFGDSLTAGYGTQPGQSYPDYLQQDLDARGYRYRVINEGVSGNTSKDGVLRVRSIVKLHPAVVIVAFGGNDGLRGVPILDSEMNLETIISALKTAHAKVILGGITLPPNYGKDYIQKFNQMYARQARDYHVPLLPFMLKGVYGVPGSMQRDGIHATAQGNRQVAENFLPLLLPVLQKSGAAKGMPNSHRSGSAAGHRSVAAMPPAQP